MTQEQADAKFAKWLEEKEKTVQGKIDGLAKAEAADKAARMKAETEAKEKKAAEVLKKNGYTVEVR